MYAYSHPQIFPIEPWHQGTQTILIIMKLELLFQVSIWKNKSISIKILLESELVTQDYVNRLEKIVTSARIDHILKNSELPLYKTPNQNFLLSSLPMSGKVETLQKIYIGLEMADDASMACAAHDLALYNIPLGLREDPILGNVEKAVFGSSFYNCTT